MGQLEVYNINETILYSVVANLSNNYISESNESNTFESFKAYFFSRNILDVFSKKLKKQSFALPAVAVTQDNGIFTTWRYFDFSKNPVIKMTKLIDDFLIWQDLTVTTAKVDENIFKLQQKYNLV